MLVMIQHVMVMPAIGIGAVLLDLWIVTWQTDSIECV
jgi:hypothetical protein